MLEVDGKSRQERYGKFVVNSEFAIDDVDHLFAYADRHPAEKKSVSGGKDFDDRGKAQFGKRSPTMHRQKCPGIAPPTTIEMFAIQAQMRLPIDAMGYDRRLSRSRAGGSLAKSTNNAAPAPTVERKMHLIDHNCVIGQLRI